MDWLSESLWHGPPLLGDRELKYDEHSNKCDECFGKKVKSWSVGLTCVSKTLGEVPLKKCFFQGDALSSPLLLEINLISLTYILRTPNTGYEFWTGNTMSHLLFMDDFKLYSKREKALDSLIQTVRKFNEDIGMQFGIDKSPILVMKKGKI